MNRTYITNIEQLKDWVFSNDMSKVAFDTECTSLNYCELEILGMSFCNGNASCYIDLDVDDQHKMIDFLRYVFKEKIKKLIGHHISFDMMVLWKIGIREHTEDIFCTQVAAHLIDECQSTSLKNLAMTVLGVPSDQIVKFRDVTEDHHSQEFYEYGIKDAEWTWELMENFYVAMSREELHQLFFKIEMPFMFILRDLSINGIGVDLDALQAIEDKVYPIQLETEEILLEMIGKKAQVQEGFWKDCEKRYVPVNFNSNKQVIPILLKQYNVKLTELTDSGNKRVRDGLEVGDDYFKLDGVVMKTLYNSCEFVRLIHKFRMAKDLKDKFTQPMKESISPDGRCRCSFNDCVATTGRLSSSDPNLQNLRKFNKVLNVECREVFVAPKGKVFIVGDYSGQELRLLAEETQDPTLLAAFRKGMDLHLVTANLLFDLGLTDEQMIKGSPGFEEIVEKYKDERHKGKNGFNFPVIYGSTEIGISRSLNIDVKEAKRLLEKFLDEYPGIKEAIHQCTQLVKHRGWVRHMFSRKRRFEKPSNKAFRQAFNFLVQGAAADQLRIGMVKVRMVLLDHPEWDAKIVLTVHDEIVVEIKEEYAEEASPLIEQALVEAVKLSIPVEVDMSSGRTYAEAK